MSHLFVLIFLQLVAEPPKLSEYQAYMDFELKEGDPARIQITFERALAENCLVPDMWTKYTIYLVSIDQCWHVWFINMFSQTHISLFD